VKGVLRRICQNTTMWGGTYARGYRRRSQYNKSEQWRKISVNDRAKKGGNGGSACKEYQNLKDVEETRAPNSVCGRVKDNGRHLGRGCGTSNAVVDQRKTK